MCSLLAQRYLAESCSSVLWIPRLQAEFWGHSAEKSLLGHLCFKDNFVLKGNQELELFLQDLLIPENIIMSLFWDTIHFHILFFPFDQVSWSQSDFCNKGACEESRQIGDLAHEGL